MQSIHSIRESRLTLVLGLLLAALLLWLSRQPKPLFLPYMDVGADALDLRESVRVVASHPGELAGPASPGKQVVN